MAITIPTRASAILLLTGLVLGGLSAGARAQEVDCAAVQGTAIPVEMRYRHGALVILQSDRASQDDFTVWTRTESTQGVVVARSTFVGGLMTESEETTNFGGTLRTYSRTFTYDGLPGSFDRRSDIDYRMNITSRMPDGTTTRSVAIYKYRFKYASTRKLGPCELVLVHATSEVEIPPSPVKNHIFQLYLPELKLGAGDPIEPAIEGLTTTFAPITPLR